MQRRSRTFQFRLTGQTAILESPFRCCKVCGYVAARSRVGGVCGCADYFTPTTSSPAGGGVAATTPRRVPRRTRPSAFAASALPTAALAASALSALAAAALSTPLTATALAAEKGLFTDRRLMFHGPSEHLPMTRVSPRVFTSGAPHDGD